VHSTVGTYLFLLGVYRAHAHPRPRKKEEDTLLFVGERGGSLMQAASTTLATTLLLQEEDQESILAAALKRHTSLLDLAKKCHLVRSVQATRSLEENTVDIRTLYLAGNAANIGYITSDAVSVHYQSVKHLLEMERANKAWNVQFGGETTKLGTVPHDPPNLEYTMGKTLAGLNFHPRGRMAQDEEEARIRINFLLTGYFKPFSGTGIMK
jgi:hypothetical protein